VQTFLPYPDFAESARVLDDRRLGKQRVETLQIMGVLLAVKWEPDGVVEREPRGWRTHPAVLMWKGHEGLLLDYQEATCAEWSGRGFRDTCWVKSLDLIAFRFDDAPRGTPAWLGHEPFHRAHQSNLVRKDPEFYGPRFPGVPPDLEYVWPTHV
jgi:hypothetical protein